MKTWVKVALVTALFAVPAMALGKVIWPPAPGGGAIGGTVPLLHLACGVRGFDVRPGHLLPPLRFRSPAAAVGATWRAWAIYLSVGWFLVSWWPHDNLHIHNGDDLQGLYIEYGFHVTLMLAGIVLAYSLLTMLRPGDAGAQTPRSDASARPVSASRLAARPNAVLYAAAASRCSRPDPPAGDARALRGVVGLRHVLPVRSAQVLYVPVMLRWPARPVLLLGVAGNLRS